MKNTERFSDRVENYVKYRPHYPKEIIPFLREKIGLDNLWILADIGSGTGISSELFLQSGNTVYCVEPNRAMREAAESHFKGNRKFISLNGTAEATSLKDHSIDLILAGQAFHWFDKAMAKGEFQRIAKPGGYLLLMWNERKGESKFHQAYEEMLFEYAPAYEEVCQNNIDEKVIREFFAPQPYFLHTFPNTQIFDFAGLKGRLLSCSYAPLESDINYQPMMRRLKQLFDQLSANGKIEFEYHCKLYCGLVN